MKSLNELGIRYDGPVLTGKITLELAKELEARRLLAKRMKDGNFARPQHYDPVLSEPTAASTKKAKIPASVLSVSLRKQEFVMLKTKDLLLTDSCFRPQLTGRSLARCSVVKLFVVIW